MKSLREQLAELFGIQNAAIGAATHAPSSSKKPAKNVHHAQNKLRRAAASLKKCPECGASVKSEQFDKHFRKVHSAKKLSNAKKRCKLSKLASSPLITIVAALKKVYHPAPKHRTPVSEGAKMQAPVSPKMNFGAWKPSVKINKCIHCGHPAMQGDNIWLF